MIPAARLSFPVLLLLAGLTAVLPAQSTSLRYVSGCPVLRVQLRAGAARYECHLLVDLARSEALFLHDNAARSLGALACDVVAGELTFKDLPVRGSRDTWLEGFTARNATGLREVPLAGYLGRAAFADHTVVLDGPGESLSLQPATASYERPPQNENRAVVELRGNPDRGGFRFRVTASADDPAAASDYEVQIDTKEAWSQVKPGVASKLGGPVPGTLPALQAGEAFDLAARTPFRPEAPAGGADLSLGGRALSRLVLTLAPGQGWLSLEDPGSEFPTDEAEFLAARFGTAPIDALATWLEGNAESPFASEAATARLQLLARSGAGVDELVEAAIARITAEAENGRSRVALQLLESLPQEPQWAAARRQVAEEGLKTERKDEDGTAGPKLHLELGVLSRRAGEYTDARGHLLSALFALPGDGVANLELGRLYEEQGQIERAESRYLLAMLDMEDTGEDGLLALRRAYAQRTGSTDGLTRHLAELSEGRVPALHPIPREPEEISPTGRVVLVELFTGAMCPPCAAADVGIDAVDDFYGADEVVVVQWHLPIPAPEPLVSQAALERARHYGVRGTPTAVLGGVEQVVGGGKADQASNMFNKYCEELGPLLEAAPELRIDAAARIEGGAVVARASAALLEGADNGRDLRLHAVLTERTLVFPGSNGILFHHHVARETLSPARGVKLAECSANSPWRTSKKLLQVEAVLDDVVGSLESRGRFRIRPIELDAGQLDVVVWVEDATSKQVLQALRVPVAGPED